MNPNYSFKEICESTLGRSRLRANWPWVSSSSSLMQIYSDFHKMNLPWWKLGKLGGIFFFHDHILLNYELLSNATTESVLFLENAFKEDKFKQIDIPAQLKELFLNKIDLDLSNWVLLDISRAKDGQKLIDLLHKMECPSISQATGDEKTVQDAPILEYAYFEEANLYNDPLPEAPGLHYQSLIPQERLQMITGECWLFRNPEPEPTDV